MPRTIVQMELQLAVRSDRRDTLGLAIIAAARNGCGAHGSFGDLWQVVRDYIPDLDTLRTADGRCRLTYASAVVGVPSSRGGRTLFVAPLPGLGAVRGPDSRHRLSWFCPSTAVDPGLRVSFSVPTVPPMTLPLSTLVAAAVPGTAAPLTRCPVPDVGPTSFGTTAVFTAEFDVALPFSDTQYVSRTAQRVSYGGDVFVLADFVETTAVDVAAHTKKNTPRGLVSVTAVDSLPLKRPRLHCVI